MQRPGPTDVEFCERLLGEVSRTFALSIQNLSPGLREAVRTAYLLCRIVDTVEDDRGLPEGARGPLFDAFDAALAASSDGRLGRDLAFSALAERAGLGSGAERELARGSAIVFSTFAALPHEVRRIISPRIASMSTGMREYAARADAAGGLRIADLADLERYCHYVAGTVGEILTDLFALECPLDAEVRARLDARAARFGLGLQLVNVLKDVAEDAARGDCFLPADLAAEQGVPIPRLLDPATRASALRLCRVLSGRAREHLRAAEEYTLLWPPDRGRVARLFCAGPLALALGTLRHVELGTDTLVPGASPTVSRDFVMGVFAALRCGEQDGASDATLTSLFERARLGIADRPSRPPEPPKPRRPAWPQKQRNQFSGESQPGAIEP